jgi:S-adenosylmethionine synthetase
MVGMKYAFTSESVCEGHPGRVNADNLSNQLVSHVRQKKSRKMFGN